MRMIRPMLVGAGGAVLGWLLLEPWRESLTYGRDLGMWFSVSLVLVWSLVIQKWLGVLPVRDMPRHLMGTWVYLILVLGLPGLKMLPPSLAAPRPVTGRDLEVETRYLVLDHSAAMEPWFGGRFGAGPMDHLKAAVSGYLQTMARSQSRDQMGCVVFAGQARELSPPSLDYGQLNARVQGLEPGGHANLLEGLRLTLQRLRVAETDLTREVILVVAGVPERRREVLDDLPKLVGLIRIHAIGVGGSYDRDLMERMSRMTGGQFYAADDVRQLAAAFQSIAALGMKGGQEEEAPWVWWVKLVLGWAGWGGLIGAAVCLLLGAKSGNRPGPWAVKRVAVWTSAGVVGGAFGVLMFWLIGGLDHTGAAARGLCYGIMGGAVGMAPAAAESLEPLWHAVQPGGLSGASAGDGLRQARQK